MEITDYEESYLYLYDHYTVVQMRAIAEHNGVKLKMNMKKLAVAKAIAEQTGDKFEIPGELPTSTKIGNSKVFSLNAPGKKRYKQGKEKVVDHHQRSSLPEEEYKEWRESRRYPAKEPILSVEEGSTDRKVAVYSKRNVHWKEVGALSSGYNFIAEEDAEKWLSLRGVRKATPEEVASYFNI